MPIWNAVKPAHAVKFDPRKCDVCGSDYTPNGTENQAWFCPTCDGEFTLALAQEYNGEPIGV